MIFSPILFKLGPLTIYWYGVTAALALIASFFYLKMINARLNKSRSIKTNLDNLFFWVIIAGVLGARLYHVLNEFSFYLARPQQILMVWKGGLAIHGGVIAGVLVLFFWAWKLYKTTPLLTKEGLGEVYLRLTDLFAPALLLALAIARWGNYFNQELFGRPTDLPWGIFIDSAHRPELYATFSYFHPTFLYQSLFYLIAVIAITLWIKKRPSIKIGLITGISLIALGLGRVMTELLRVDQVPLVLGIRLPLLVSIIIIIVGGDLLVHAHLRQRVKKHLTKPTS